MVYGFLPTTIAHHVLEDPFCYESSTITLVAKRLPTDLLAVCRFISSEAKPFLAKKTEALKSEPLRLIVDATSANLLLGARLFSLSDYSLFYHVGKQREVIRNYGLTQSQPSHLKTLGFDTSELLDLNAFARKCAVHAETRSPRSTIIAFRQHPEYQVKELFGLMYQCSNKAHGAAKVRATGVVARNTEPSVTWR
jgi:hypothetical protein